MSTAPDGLRTEEPAVTDGPGDPRRPGRLAAGLLTATFLLVVLAAGLTFVGLPYVVLSPGPATNVLGQVDGKPVLSVEGAKTYPTDGALDFTTVIFGGGPGRTVTVYDLLEAWVRDDVDAVPESYYFPEDATADQVDAANAEMMNESQVVAAVTALRALGRTVPTRVAIADVPEGSPSTGRLEKGDVIVSVDGAPASDTTAVRAAVQAHQPGEGVRLVVERAGARRTVEVTTAKGADGAVVGVVLRTDYDLPVTVTLNTGQVGGPSAGLMFTLAIYDALTPGPLTGGQRIAGTGTIEDGGAVGPISGIRQKMVGARAAGARWFLSPEGDCADAVGHVPDGMTVFKVTSFDDARAAVEGIAAGKTSGLPTCG